SGPMTVFDDLPAEVTFKSCFAPGGTCGGIGNNRTVSFTGLANGASSTITIVATVRVDVPSNTLINNMATVSNDTPDLNQANNSATATVTKVGPSAADSSISGKVTTPGGGPLGGVVLMLGGSNARQTITDSGGDYR